MWGYKINAKHYSNKAIKKLNSLVDNRRKIFEQEYSFSIKNSNNLYLGSRFNDNEKILWVLESKVTEYEFMLTPEIFIDKILLGAAESDYYYTHEKEW